MLDMTGAVFRIGAHFRRKCLRDITEAGADHSETGFVGATRWEIAGFENGLMNRGAVPLLRKEDERFDHEKQA